MRSNHPALYRQIQELAWVGDGFSEVERETIKRISWLAGNARLEAATVIAMPFLESVEADDVLALMGINGLARNKADGRLSALMDHPTLRNGITDDLTTLVTTVATIRDADEIRRMLNPGYADIETVSAGTELTPNLKISIVRPGTQRQPETMEAFKDAIQFAEDTMQLPLPLPVSHVILVLNDEAVAGSGTPANFGFAFSALPGDEQAPGARRRQTLYSIIVHEIAHYYWVRMSNWINEGVAVIFEYRQAVRNGVDLRLLEEYPRITHNAECEAHDLKMLSEWNPRATDWMKFWCNYHLGRMLFLELLENMGTEEFNQGLRELYRLSLAAREADRTPGIAEVRQAFQEQSDIVEKHWSGKLNAPENRPWDEGLAHSSHNLIQWDQYPTYDGEFVTFRGTVLGDAVLSSGTIREAERDGYQNFHLYPVGKNEFGGNIYPPGWGHNTRHPGDTTALDYRLEGRTFTVRFRLPQVLGDPSGYFVDVWGFQDESRTPVIWDARDRLGYARIRVE